jgi:hypothetical protein
VRELARFYPALHALIGGGIIQKYVDREGVGCFSNTAPSASRRRLDEAGRDLILLVVQFTNTAAAALPGYVLLDLGPERAVRDQARRRERYSLYDRH